MKKNLFETKKSVIVTSVLITIIFIFFSVPNFVSKAKIDELKNRFENGMGNQNFPSSSKPGSVIWPDHNNNNNNSFNDPENNNNNSENNSNNNQNNNNNSNNNQNSNENNNSFNNNENNNNNSENNNNNNNSNSNNNSNNNQNNNNNNNSSNPPNENSNPHVGNVNPSEENPSTPEYTVTYTATFIENGASISESTKSCTTKGTSCTITLPEIYSSKDVLGWSTNQNATSTNLKPNTQINISQDTLYFAITKKDLVVTIDGNGAFDGVITKNCTYYNRDSSCEVTLPDLNNDFYTTVGFSTSPDSTTLKYSDHATIRISNNMTLYSLRKIETSPYDKYSNVAKEVFNKLNALRREKGKSTLSWNKSLELSAMLRVSEVMRNYDFNVNGNYHYRISNNKPFYTANELAYGENFNSLRSLSAEEFHQEFVNSPSHYDNMIYDNFDKIGIAISFDGTWYYVLELFG